MPKQKQTNIIQDDCNMFTQALDNATDDIPDDTYIIIKPTIYRITNNQLVRILEYRILERLNGL